MDAGVRCYGDEVVAVLSAATAVLRELPARVARLTGPDLDTVLPVVDALAAVAAAGRFTVTAEAVQRGEVTGSQAGSTAQWVADRCPTLDGREAGLVAKAVRELAAGSALAPLSPGLAGARAAVEEGRLSVSAGCVVASELRQLAPLVEPDAVESVAAGLVAMGAVDGPVGVRRLRPAMLARYGLGDLLQDLEDRHRGLTVLSCGRDIGGGITEYRLRLNPEARAVVEAAINALTKPVVVDGVRDPRTVDQRRGDALVTVCRRAAALTPALTATDPTVMLAAARPSGVKATVLVTINLDDLRNDLRNRTRPGVLVGGVDAGALLGPDTVRRLACDAALIPAVLDSGGQLIHLGRTRRPFTSAQIRALWLRDRHCTFPGCQAPATWCDAHHLRHWADGGPTDLANGVLLCERHHSIVHRDRLHATPTPTGVAWDRRPGSYDRALARGPTPGGSDP
jgi:hypothetical protein